LSTYFTYRRSGANAAEVNAFNFIDKIAELMRQGLIKDYIIVRTRERDGIIHFKLKKK